MLLIILVTMGMFAACTSKETAPDYGPETVKKHAAKNGGTHSMEESARMPASESRENGTPPVMEKSMPVPAAPATSPRLTRNSRYAAREKRMEPHVESAPAVSRAPASVDMAPDMGGGMSASAASEPVPPAAPKNGHGGMPGALVSPETISSVADKYGKYKVELGADSNLKIPGEPGELRVWIGDPAYKAHFPESLGSRDSALIDAVGEYGIVRPFSTGLTVEPEKSGCIKIHPTGSTEKFKLIPKEEGVFIVEATVDLFDSDDCSGAPIPKDAEKALRVKVEVDADKIRKNRVEELMDVLWKKFVEFWAAVVALFFAVVLFLLRKQLKKWFGYGE